MWTLLLVGTLVGSPISPPVAANPAVAVAPRATTLITDAASTAAALLRSLTPGQIQALRARRRLTLAPGRMSESQRSLVEQLTLALRPGASPSARPAVAVGLLATADGTPALALWAGGAEPIAVRRRAIACHW